MTTNECRVTIRLRPELYAELEARAASEHRTMANMVTVIIEQATERAGRHAFAVKKAP